MNAPSKHTTAAGFDPPQLVDNQGRIITYLRLAITDRCNLRCSYCMPEDGVETVSHGETLSYEELERLARLFLEMGIEKIRITGGEPFVRRGCINFMERLKHDLGVTELVVTTNGVETARYLKRLKELPISGINLSLDTLDRKRFKTIARRDRLADVLQTLYGALELGIRLKVNSVVSEETSDAEIFQLGELARDNNLSMRFIEKMPFSGEKIVDRLIDYGLVDRLANLFPGLDQGQTDNGSTAKEFNIPGFKGSLGIIEGSSRKFCSTCNRVRITPQGILKVCLYDNGVLDLKELMRTGTNDEDLLKQIRSCLNRRFADGHQTESANGRAVQPSMASIGG
ncbi:MAG: GTP 3',8-cyclase MoaA [Desulfofustis sp.]|nr:GTP 3',8-cyclase MoaA [Desulfofustis sp.]